MAVSVETTVSVDVTNTVLGSGSLVGEAGIGRGDGVGYGNTQGHSVSVNGNQVHVVGEVNFSLTRQINRSVWTRPSFVDSKNLCSFTTLGLMNIKQQSKDC